jgi:hypothetical protein
LEEGLELGIDLVGEARIEEVDESSVETTQESGDLEINVTNAGRGVGGIELDGIRHVRGNINGELATRGSDLESVVELEEQDVDLDRTFNDHSEVLDTELDITFFKVSFSVLDSEAGAGDLDAREVHSVRAEVGDGERFNLVNKEVQRGILE